MYEVDIDNPTLTEEELSNHQKISEYLQGEVFFDQIMEEFKILIEEKIKPDTTCKKKMIIPYEGYFSEGM